MQIVVCDKSQKGIRVSGVVPFRMESGSLLRVKDVLFVLELKYNVLSVSVIEQKGFEMIFQDGKARLRPRGSNFVGVVVGVREHGLYLLMGKPIDHEKQEQILET